MKIESVSFRKHFLFENTQINFFADSKPNADQSAKSFEISFGKNQAQNAYTYLIGENGTGKTALLKSLVGIFNFRSDNPESKITALHKFLGKTKYNVYNNSFSESQFLIDKGMDIYDNAERDKVLRDIQVIYFSNTLEQGLISRNRNFRSFNYFSDINKTKYLALRAISKSDKRQQLEALDEILNKGKPIDWTVKSALLDVKFDDDQGDAPKFIVIDERIYDLITMIRKVGTSNAEVLNTAILTDSEQKLLALMEKDGFFFKLYFDSNLPVSEFFNKISKCYLFNRIVNFMGEEEIRTRKNVLRMAYLRSIADDDELIDIDRLTEFDVLLCGILENLKFLKVDLMFNKKPIEWLSSGEQSLIRLCSFFADIPNPEDRKNLLVIIDEPENSLHPRWQHNFPVHFRAIVEAYHVHSSHFIFATHSPLIIMKAVHPEITDDTAVIRLVRENEKIVAKLIEDINAYSIEEVMLDEFNIGYRDPKRDINVYSDLQRGFEKSKSDPIRSVENLDDFHNKISDLLKRYRE